MKSGKKKLLNFLLIFGTLGIVLFFSFQNQSFEEVLGAVSAMDLRWILLCIVFYLGFLVADSLSIQYFLRRQGYRVTWGYGFFVSVAGQYYSNITPGATGGQPMQVYYLHQRYIPTGVATSALVAVVLAFVMGAAASRSLTRPIKVITSTAAQIRGGDLTARTGLSGDDEIGRLGETFDSMATNLERDIQFEHRLTSDVAHELRTPLMAMLVTVEAMQDGVLPADDEHFETVATEVRRLSRLVDAMLHLSRIENGKRDFKIERTDVVHLVKSLVSVQHQLFHERGLHLRFDDKTARHECYAEIDADLIREAITNIMSNAMRYTPQDGWIVVSVSSDRRNVLISVRDTGIGIAEEDIPRVFSRFWRSDASRERVSGGLGVGLAITKEIVDQHNGTIQVESELGKGTTITLRIPQTRRRDLEREDREA